MSDIINLKNQGKDSQEISEILNIPKINVDIELIKDYCSVDSRKHLLGILINVIKDLNTNPNKTYTELSKYYNVSSKTLSYHLLRAQIFIYRKNANVRHKFNQNDIDKIYELWKEGNTFKQIGLKYNISGKAIKNLLKFNNYNLSNCIQDYFNIIDSEEKAYWLGFLCADGCIELNKMSVDLKILDILHLEKLKISLNAKSTVRTENKLQRCRFAIRNKYLVKGLIANGCTSKKSLTLKFPDLSVFKDKSLIRHFIRGYFDGDGCLSFIGTKYLIPTVSIIGTKEFLDGIIKNTSQEWRFEHDKRHHENTFSIVTTNKKEAISFIKWIYEDSTIYLNRKYQRFLCFKENDFAVLRSDFENNDRAISEKTKSYIKQKYPNFVFKTQVNSEINTESKKSVSS